jgi:hypothetical protein
LKLVPAVTLNQSPIFEIASRIGKISDKSKRD